jgi:hypothetical protein
MSAPNSGALYVKLDALYQTIDNLKPTSTPEEFTAFGAFFAENCTVYLKSMREYEKPSIGRAATISSLKEILLEYHVAERRTLSRSVTTSADGAEERMIVYSEAKNKLHVLGQNLDPFYETAVVTFVRVGEDWVVSELKNYSCRSHIIEIMQRETGKGPYATWIIPARKEEEKGGKSACCQ